MKKLIACLAVTVTASAAAFAADFENISIKELKKAIENQKAVVIDAMGERSYKAAHVPTAISYPANKDDFGSVLPKEKNALIVVYCGGPDCSAYLQAAEAAAALGYTNIRHMSVGISGWIEAGEKIEKG